MTALDRLIPLPALVEVDSIDLGVPPAHTWEVVRHADLALSPLVRALFAVRALPARIGGRAPQPSELRLDTLTSSAEEPGFQVLADDGRSEVTVGAIGKVWHLQIPFVHVRDAEAFQAFAEPGYVKVAWALRVSPRGDSGSTITVEVRVDATDADSWARFRRYFALIGPGSHFIRRSLLSSLAERLGTPESKREQRSLPGDELLAGARTQMTLTHVIHARPETIWPWLVQMGCARGGFYSIDTLDNDGVRSAREIHPELQRLRPGDVLPATPGGEDGFEVLALEPDRLLVLGGLYDAETKRQRPFSSARSQHFWHVTWTFYLERIDPATTCLHVRARAAFAEGEHLHAEWIRPVHHLMQAAQLEHLAQRAEGTLPSDDWRDVLAGVGGAAIMVAAFVTPFQRKDRGHWGVSEDVANRSYPGDELVAAPDSRWTHGIEIEAPAEDVWPWIRQLGADRGGFYSYQWLENVAGCQLRNAEALHAEWTIAEGDLVRLHPKAPPLRVARCERGSFFVLHAPADTEARAAGKPWAEVSWLFYLEPLGTGRCRLVSRYRCATSDDLATRMRFGPTFIEPVGFAMDRRMLLGVKSRAEVARTRKPLRSLTRRRAAQT